MMYPTSWSLVAMSFELDGFVAAEYQTKSIV